MENYIIDFITNYGYLAIFLLIAIENIFPPIPSEIVLTFGGFMATKASLSIFGVIMVATLGSYIGAIILYYLGYLLQPSKFQRLIEHRIIKKLGFKYEDIDKAMHWFDKHGKITILLCRLVPIIRSLISIPAGMAKMNFIIFSLWTLVGTLIWNTILVFIGNILGANWGLISGYIKDYAIFLIIGVSIIGITWFYIKKRKQG